MRALSLFLLLAVICCAGCTNKYGDDPSMRGLPTPAATPVPIAPAAEK